MYNLLMDSKLVFLHIPKTGGASVQQTLFDLYRRKNVFWFGVDDAHDKAKKYRADLMKDPAVLGGHQPVSYYPTELDALTAALQAERLGDDGLGSLQAGWNGFDLTHVGECVTDIVGDGHRLQITVVLDSDNHAIGVGVVFE